LDPTTLISEYSKYEALNASIKREYFPYLNSYILSSFPRSNIFHWVLRVTVDSSHILDRSVRLEFLASLDFLLPSATLIYQTDTVPERLIEFWPSEWGKYWTIEIHLE
jgi:hypothetical protein